MAMPEVSEQHVRLAQFSFWVVTIITTIVFGWIASLSHLANLRKHNADTEKAKQEKVAAEIATARERQEAERLKKKIESEARGDGAAAAAGGDASPSKPFDAGASSDAIGNYIEGNAERFAGIARDLRAAIRPLLLLLIPSVVAAAYPLQWLNVVIAAVALMAIYTRLRNVRRFVKTLADVSHEGAVDFWATAGLYRDEQKAMLAEKQAGLDERLANATAKRDELLAENAKLDAKLRELRGQ